MDRQTITFAVTVKNGVVTDIGKMHILHPEIRFSGESIKWYEDKKKESNSKINIVFSKISFKVLLMFLVCYKIYLIIRNINDYFIVFNFIF